MRPSRTRATLGLLVGLALPAASARADESAAAPCPHHAGVATPPAAEPVRDESLYGLDIRLRDQDDTKIGLDVFRGRPVVVALFYASCKSLCPLLIADLQRLEKALSPADRDRLGVVLVSLDAEHDGPPAFRELIARHGLDAKRWRLTTAAPNDVQTLAAVLGVRYTKLPDGGFAHSAVITLLTPSGEIDARVEGSAQPIDALAARIGKP